MRAPAPPVPGRLRLSFSQLKQQHALLERMAASLAAINGVITVETCATTGGLLIQFDSVVGNTPVFWDRIESVLHSYELMHNPRPMARMRSKGRDAGPAQGGGDTDQARQPDPDAGPIAHARQAEGASDDQGSWPGLVDRLLAKVTSNYLISRSGT